MNLRETYNKIAEDWFRDHKSDDWWIESTDKFISLFRLGAVILDIGCGAGIKSKYLNERGLQVVGVDFSEKFIDIAKKEVPTVSFYAMDMKDVSSLGQQFDGVFAQASLLHIPKKEIQDILKTLTSVLKPNGYMHIAVKAVNSEEKEEEIVKENDYGYEYERFFSYYTIDELKRYLKDLSFDIVYQNEKLNGKTTWLQIIGKKIT